MRGALGMALTGAIAAGVFSEGGRQRGPRSQPGDGSIATENRHTGLPHKHEREIARRRRQLAHAA